MNHCRSSLKLSMREMGAGGCDPLNSWKPLLRKILAWGASLEAWFRHSIRDWRAVFVILASGRAVTHTSMVSNILVSSMRIVMRMVSTVTPIHDRQVMGWTHLSEASCSPRVTVVVTKWWYWAWARVMLGITAAIVSSIYPNESVFISSLVM